MSIKWECHFLTFQYYGYAWAEFMYTCMLTANGVDPFYILLHFCDRCRACKSFKKKKGCCSVDFEICREVIPEKKVDKCFSKCSYDKDCSDLVLPNSDDVCLLDGGCSRTKSKRKKNYDSYQKSQKYYTSNMEIEYVDENQKYGHGKYGDNKGRRILWRDTDYNYHPVNVRRAKTTIQKGRPKSYKTVRRRRLYNRDIPS